MRRLRKEIERLNTIDGVPGGGEHRRVTCEGGGVARDVEDTSRPQLGELPDLLRREGRPPREHLEREHPERILIGARVAALARSWGMVAWEGSP